MDAHNQEPLAHLGAALPEHTLSGFCFACGLHRILVWLSRWSKCHCDTFTDEILRSPFSSYASNLFVPPAEYGIGSPTAVRSIPEAISGVTGGRNKVVFVNNGFTGGDIDKVIEQVAEPVRDSGMFVEVLSSPSQVPDVCRSSLQGVSTCIAGAIFFSSPEEGEQGQWNYTINSDASLGGFKIRTGDLDNDAQLYILPFQHAIDSVIASLNETTGDASLNREVS